jgi:hypothetical protein
MKEESEEALKAKFVQLLAKAASDKAYFDKLKADPEGTLQEEGIDGFFIQVANDATLNEIFHTFGDLGGVICKRH